MTAQVVCSFEVGSVHIRIFDSSTAMCMLETLLRCPMSGSAKQVIKLDSLLPDDFASDPDLDYTDARSDANHSAQKSANHNARKTAGSNDTTFSSRSGASRTVAGASRSADASLGASFNSDAAGASRSGAS